MKRILAFALSGSLFLVFAPSASADVGIVSASPRGGAPGGRVELTLGCGFCFPPCVGEPGHRHPPGDLHGTCMLGTHGGPPAAFAIWLTPIGHSLAPFKCRPGQACEAGSSRPPHVPSFIFLGRAVPMRESDEPHSYPRYRLIFGVPEARPGLYKYVIFCDSCFAGPRGSLISFPGDPRLRVRPSDAPVATTGSGAGPWIAAGILAAVVALGAGLVVRRGRPAGPQPRGAA